MELIYHSYDNYDLKEELKWIEICDSADITVDQKNKKCLFIMGMLFANGAKIRVLNEDELEFNGTNKSFNMMAYVWSRIADKTLPLNPSVDNVMNERIEAAIESGVEVHKIENNPIPNKIFLISPVRNATDEQRKWIEDFMNMKIESGSIMHVPHLHTNQIDPLGGFNICTQNAYALASSEEIDIYYDQKSTGSIFDLGVAYALGKPLRLLNREEIVLDQNDFIDDLIDNWPYNNNKQFFKS